MRRHSMDVSYYLLILESHRLFPSRCLLCIPSLILYCHTQWPLFCFHLLISAASDSALGMARTPLRFPVVSATLQSLDFLLTPLAAAPHFPRRAAYLPSSQGSAVPLLTPRSHFSSPPFIYMKCSPSSGTIPEGCREPETCMSILRGLQDTPALDPNSLPSMVI